jgi:cytochrome c-type biogenesis protein CcmH/NrfF
MRCAKCDVELREVGLSQVAGGKIFATLECPSCHNRTIQEKKKPFMTRL